ncbi:MAG: hypothetical protein ACM3KM_01445 [Acidobacteriaceae bacterium]
MANKKDTSGMHAKGSPISASTQSIMSVEEIKEGTILLKDSSLRAVLVVSSTNFSLKSADEQNALIAAYQSFLNSLEYPIQILMQSRKLDINTYLDKLREMMQRQTNELLRLQTQEYIEYIGKLVEYASIMTKTFYIIVPYSLVSVKGGLMSKLSSLFNPAGTIKLKEEDFVHHREELYNRVNHISGTLNGMGLRTMVLSTEELVELIYNSYNLEASSSIKIKSIEELDVAGKDIHY